MRGHKLALVVDCGFGDLEASAVSIDRLTECLAGHDFAVELLRGPAATRRGVRDWLGERAGALGPGDAFAFAYVGHGARLRDPLYREEDLTTPPALADLLFLVTHEVLGDLDEPEAGIPGVDLMAWLHPIAEATDNVTVLLDCCHAGELAGSGLFADGPARAAYGAALGRVLALVRAKYRRGHHRSAASVEQRIVRVVATARNEYAVEGPGVAGAPLIGLFSDAFAESLAGPDARALTWDDHIDAIAASVRARCPVQNPGLEGPRDRLPFSRDTRDLSDSAVCRPVPGGRFEVLAGRLHGLELGDSLRVHRAADHCVVDEVVVKEVGPYRALAARVQVLRSASGPASGRGMREAVERPAARATRGPVETHAARATRGPVEAHAVRVTRGPVETHLGEATRGASEHLRAVPIERAVPVRIAVDPEPAAIAGTWSSARLARAGVELVAAGEPADATLELREHAVRLLVAGAPVFVDAPAGSPAAFRRVFSALWRVAHARRIERGVDACAGVCAEVTVAWGLVGSAEPLPLAGAELIADSRVWIRVTTELPEQFVDVLHVRADRSVHHLTARLDHGQTIGCGCVTELTRGDDCIVTPWSEHVPRDAPARECFLVVCSTEPASLHGAASPRRVTRDAAVRGGAVVRSTCADGAAPTVARLEYRLAPRASPSA